MTGTPRASVPSAMPRRVTASSTVPSGLLAGFNRYTSSLRSPRRSALIRATGNRLLLLCIMLLHKKGRRPEEPALLESLKSPISVGASLLAKAVYQPTSMSDVDPSSRAGSLPQEACLSLTPSDCRLAFSQEEPGFQYGIGVQRNAFDALLHQPFGQVRVIRRTLTADADVLASLVTGLNRVGQQLLDGRITLVEQVSDDPGVTVQPQC